MRTQRERDRQSVNETKPELVGVPEGVLISRICKTGGGELCSIFL